MSCCCSNRRDPPATASIYVATKQHFNFLRNNSRSMSDALTYSHLQCNCHHSNQDSLDQPDQQRRSFQQPNANKQLQSNANSKNKTVTFNPKQNKSFNSNKNSTQQNTQAERQNLSKREGRAKSVVQTRPKRVESEEQLEAKRQKQEENRQKVCAYLESMIPFTREISNSRFQDYYNKSAMEPYGRANINQPMGGVEYGNNLKTFNINPHIKSNNPTYYQTHQTSISFAKRAKLSEENKFKLLQKQLTKKLGLNAKNETLKEGKNVVYVDVNQHNMYEVMKENHDFAKEHAAEIRSQENKFKEEKQMEHEAAIEEFYQTKKSRIASTIHSSAKTISHDREDSSRIAQQVVYKLHDEHGNQRVGADRHALTCFIDMNFPENDSLYTKQLVNRNPIFPIKVAPADRNIEQTQKNNYQANQSNPYPSHYLVNSVVQPEIKKMLSNGSTITGKRTN